MRKTLTAGLTALSLVLIPAAPAQANNSNDSFNRAVIGLLAAGALGLAINKSRDGDGPNVQLRINKGQSDRHRNVQRFGDTNRHARVTRRADPLPSRCFRQIELRNGHVQKAFGARCLDRRYRDVASLPRQCLVRLGGRNGSRFGYEAHCLRDRGFRADRRW